MQSVALENILMRQPPRWLPANYANYDELLAGAVEAVIASPEAPKALNTWAWGKARPLELDHPILGKIPLLRRWTGPGRYAAGGDGYHRQADGPWRVPALPAGAVGAHDGGFCQSRRQHHEHRYRAIRTDVGPHYLDQWKSWLDGRSFSFAFSDAAVERAKAHELRLEPVK